MEREPPALEPQQPARAFLCGGDLHGAERRFGVTAGAIPQRAVARVEEDVIQPRPEAYGDAHFNLAILYIEAPKPNLLLARQHYQLRR